MRGFDNPTASSTMFYDTQQRSTSALSYTRDTTTEVSPKTLSASTYTGQNIGKVRWLQDNQRTQYIPDPSASEYFISTSLGKTNQSSIKLWKCGQKNAELIDTILSASTVTDVATIADDVFALTTSDGGISIYKCPKEGDSGGYDRIQHVITNKLHNIDGVTVPARTVASNGSKIVTGGEDGSLFVCDNSGTLERSLEKVDPQSIWCALAGQTEIITGNAAGQVKVYDFRDSGPPKVTMNPNNSINSVYGTISIAVHPAQKHLIIVSYQSGWLDLFDLRHGNGCDPIANLASDVGPLSELYFHPVNPDHFFACSQFGSVYHWYPGQEPFDMQSNNTNYRPDVNVEFLRHGLMFRQLYSTPFPVNSLNLSKHDRLVSGGDDGIIYCTSVSVNN